jgi:hypothetical protein
MKVRDVNLEPQPRVEIVGELDGRPLHVCQHGDRRNFV